MSKIITTRFEYACFDDAAPGSSLSSAPPMYPPTLDQYNSTTIGNTGAGYGVSNIQSTGTTYNIVIPATASATLVCPTSNTTMVGVTLNAALVPVGAAVAMPMLCGPGQTISIPAAWVGTPLIVNAYTANGSATLNTAFAGQLLWSF